MRGLKFVFLAVLLMGSIRLFTSVSFGKAEYTKKEKKACVYCHVKPNSKELNETGKCYKDSNYSLKGCEPKKAEEKKS